MGSFTIISNGIRLPLAALPTANGYGLQGVALLYSDYEGEAVLQPWADMYNADAADLAYNGEVMHGTPGVPIGPQQLAAAGINLDCWVANTHKFPDEIDAMLKAGVIVDTGKRMDFNFYKNLPAVKFTAPVDPLSRKKVLQKTSGGSSQKL